MELSTKNFPEEIAESRGWKDLEDHPVRSNPSFPGESVFPYFVVLSPENFGFGDDPKQSQTLLGWGFRTKGQEKTLGEPLTFRDPLAVGKIPGFSSSAPLMGIVEYEGPSNFSSQCANPPIGNIVNEGNLGWKSPIVHVGDIPRKLSSIYHLFTDSQVFHQVPAFLGSCVGYPGFFGCGFPVFGSCLGSHTGFSWHSSGFRAP